MDPAAAIALAASIVTVIDAISTVVKCITGIPRAPLERERLAQELVSLLPLFVSIREKVRKAQQTDDWSTGIRYLGAEKGLLDQFKGAMEDLAGKLEHKTGLKRIVRPLLWTIDKNECNEILVKIERMKTVIGLALQGDILQMTQTIQAETAELPALTSRIAELQLSDFDSKFRFWLNPPDPSSNHAAALRKRQPTTGSWFTGGSQFASWKSGTASLLWLYGITGCGKTVLCSSIIQEIIQHSQQDPSSTMVYFYFDFKEPDKQNHDKLLRSLASQLSANSREARAILQSLYVRCQNGAQQSTPEALLQVLRQMLQCFEHSYVVLDALDECEPREDVLLFIEEVISWKLSNLHILATGREEKVIRDYLDPLVTEKICMMSALVNPDIRTHIQERLRNDRDLRLWPAKVKDEIESSLMSGADGMFRWVTCQLDTLRNCFDLKKLREALRSLPKGLDNTYDRMLLSINNSAYHKEAFIVLQWLCFSARPMQLNEIVEVLAVDPEGDRFDPEQRFPAPRNILRVCSSLVVVGNADIRGRYRDIVDVEVVNLAHLSVKEYLVGDRIQKVAVSSYRILVGPAHTTVVKVCLAYLLYFQGANILTEHNVKSYGLAEYAAQYWTHHMQVAMDQESDPKQVEQLQIRSCRLLDNADCLLSSIRLFDPDRSWTSPDFRMRVGDLAPALYYVSLVGLHSMVKPLLQRGAVINAKSSGSSYGTALQAACMEGHSKVTQQLLAEGADPNVQSERYGTPLQAVSRRGYGKIVQQLLVAGADLNIQGGIYGTALQAASARGRYKVVLQLLSAGADVNVQGGLYGTALVAAAAGGHERVVQQLLAAGATRSEAEPRPTDYIDITKERVEVEVDSEEELRHIYVDAW